MSYKVIPEGIRLSWSVPVKNIDGSPLAKIKGFQLLKAAVPAKGACLGCPPPFGRPINIPFEARPEKTRRMVYEDRTLSTGMRYTYRVCTVKGWLNVSDPSNQVSLAWHVPPSPPSEFMAQPSKNGIYLSWQAPINWVDGSSIDKKLLFRIYKAKIKGNWRIIPGLVDSTGYFDIAVKKGIRYRYKVAAVLIYYGSEIEGLCTHERMAQPGDLTPPAAPRGLVAVQAPRGVEILWQENAEPDLAGYIVYRQDPDGLIDRLNNRPVYMPRFLDRTILPSGTYRYWVTAIDQAYPPNESAPSEKATVEVVKRRHGRP
ncbi:MAG: hypothetical protein GWP10_02110 [Nitrospiraceae bacterium]|nr:hypothetical protein [Nitrospiraceae bacterium]